LRCISGAKIQNKKELAKRVLLFFSILFSIAKKIVVRVAINRSAITDKLGEIFQTAKRCKYCIFKVLLLLIKINCGFKVQSVLLKTRSVALFNIFCLSLLVKLFN